MSVLPQELMRKMASTSQESSERISSSKPTQRFRELMRVSAIDDKPKKKNLFSLVEEKDDKQEERTVATAPFTPPSTQTSLLPGSVAPPSCLTSQIEALFEKMASSMMMMCSSGETETTLFLDNPHFASSIFFGSTITIREFSTAPKAFNVEITASLAATALIDAHKQELLARFHEGKFHFSLHRIDTSVHSEDRPVLHRKENDDHEHQDQKGDRE